MSWDDTCIFLALTRAPTSRAAARSLGVDQATVGRRLNALEAELSAKLFLRAKDGYLLTAAGETALAAAARELAEETSVRADPLEYLANLDIILRDADGRLEHHFFLVAVLCRYRGGAPQAADDATHAAWVPVAQVLSGALPMSRDVDRVLRRALESPQEPGWL